MAQNSLSPAFIKLYYTNGVTEHVMTLPTKLGSGFAPGEDPNLVKHTDTTVLFSTYIASLKDSIRGCFHSGTTLDTAEIWSQPTPEDDPVWIYTVGITAAGTHGTANVVASQLVMTFRSDLGGLFRLYLMEQPVGVNQAVKYTAMSNPQLALANAITATSSAIYARDNGAPILCLGYKTKTNDVLRRRLLTG